MPIRVIREDRDGTNRAYLKSDGTWQATEAAATDYPDIYQASGDALKAIDGSTDPKRPTG